MRSGTDYDDFALVFDVVRRCRAALARRYGSSEILIDVTYERERAS